MATLAATHLPAEVASPVPQRFYARMAAACVAVAFVAAMLHDRRTRGRVHPVYWVAGGAVLAVQLLRVPLSGTDGWLRVTDWLLAMSP